MDVFLIKVEETFDITGRGLIISPFFPVSEYKFDSNEKVRVETPNGEELLCDSHFQIPFQTPPPKVMSFCCALLNVSKEQIPEGSKIFILGKTKDEITA